MDELCLACDRQDSQVKFLNPNDILEAGLAEAKKNLKRPLIADKTVYSKLDYVCRCESNRAGVRLLLSCLLAKVCQPKVNALKPYTEIGTKDSFSGRTYDERYLTHFINKNQLPCNTTTAFLTPVLRNMNQPLSKKVELIGRPREVYAYTIELLEEVQRSKLTAKTLLTEAIRLLLVIKKEKDTRMSALLQVLQTNKGALPLSCESIVTLIEQHLACKNSSRLPVLIVSAAYQSATRKTGKAARPLYAHNAADLQTGAIGDVEICLVGDANVVSAYEMKMKRVTIDDIDAALQKIAKTTPKIQNYIFITTDCIEPAVREYASKLYEQTGGTEIAILDCVGFLRHFLHLFHELRIDFLDTYQKLVLSEDNSAVSQPLKEAFLALRQSAESEG